jgi:ABC-type multidrug transport system ATPase subunit
MISVEELSKRYLRGQGGTLALSNLSLEVERGEALALLGRNGAGKSTVVKILSTLIRSDRGHASIAGFDVVKQAPRIREVIGVALQEVGVYPAARVRQILTLHARLLGLDRAAATRRSGEIVEFAGLGQVTQQRVHRLSGGMRRRLDLGLALIHRPPVLLLDEPTDSLDPFSRQEFWAELARLRDHGTCILFATQNLEEAEFLADRVAILDDGVLWRDDTPATALREVWSSR